MEERTPGIIVRTRPLTETSLIVQWLTRDHGRISTVAKGARRPGSPFQGKLDLFYEADLSFQRSRRSELHILREVALRDTHARLRQDLGWVRQACYFAVLLEKSTETDAPIPEMYQLLQEALNVLPSRQSGSEIVFLFELKLLSTLGYEPDLDCLAEPTSTASKTAMHASLENGAAVLAILPARLKRELNGILHRSIGTVLERVPPQRELALPIER